MSGGEFHTAQLLVREVVHFLAGEKVPNCPLARLHHLCSYLCLWEPSSFQPATTLGIMELLTFAPFEIGDMKYIYWFKMSLWLHYRAQVTFSHLICIMSSGVGIGVLFHMRKLRLREGKWLARAKQCGNRESKPGFLTQDLIFCTKSHRLSNRVEGENIVCVCMHVCVQCAWGGKMAECRLFSFLLSTSPP